MARHTPIDDFHSYAARAAVRRSSKIFTPAPINAYIKATIKTTVIQLAGVHVTMTDSLDAAIGADLQNKIVHLSSGESAVNDHTRPIGNVNPLDRYFFMAQAPLKRS